MPQKSVSGEKQPLTQIIVELAGNVSPNLFVCSLRRFPLNSRLRPLLHQSIVSARQHLPSDAQHVQP